MKNCCCKTFSPAALYSTLKFMYIDNLDLRYLILVVVGANQWQPARGQDPSLVASKNVSMGHLKLQRTSQFTDSLNKHDLMSHREISKLTLTSFGGSVRIQLLFGPAMGPSLGVMCCSLKQ